MSAAYISILLKGSIIIVCLLLITVSFIAFLFYRYTVPSLPSSKKIVLSLLRALSLCLLLLIIFEPILRILNSDNQMPIVAVLIDNSQSISISNSSSNNAKTLRAFLDERPFTKFPSGVIASTFLFSSKPQPSPNFSADSLSLNGETTNLSEVLVELKDRLVKENIQAVVILSDGNYTVGKNPLYDAEALGIPVFTIGLGDTSEQKDILIEKVVTNSIAYAGSRLPIDVTIKNSGFNGDNVEVAISEGVNVIDRKIITLRNDVQEYPLRLMVEPKDEGVKKFTINISKLKGELTEKNNYRSIFVKVLKSKLHVLIVAGTPNPDVAVVRQALVEDTNLSVFELVQKNQNEFYERTFSRTILDSADCFVFVEFPSFATSNNVIQQIADIVSKSKKPLLFINGKTVDYTKLQHLEPFLPFTWRESSQNEDLVFVSIPEKQKANTLIELNGIVTSDIWLRLPPIYKMHTNFRAKPESDILVLAKMQNIALDEPLIATRKIAGHKAFAITGYGIWRWKLLNQSLTNAVPVLPLFISNAVRWLTTKEEEKSVRITPTKEFFTTAEPIEFTAQVYDDQMRPVDQAEVTVHLQNTNNKLQTKLNSIGNGLYECSIDGLSEGDYSFAGNAVKDMKAIGEDKGRLSVGQMNIEFVETKMNKQLLEQIAFRTGGHYYDLEKAKAIVSDMNKDIQFSPKELVQTSELEMWNWHYLAMIIILLLGVEWFLRKRMGMI